MLSELQYRAISGMLAYPSLAHTVPSYCFTGSEYEPMYKAIKMMADNELTMKGFMYGMCIKYPVEFWEALRAVENSECVPRESWAKFQINNLKKVFDSDD